MLSTEQKNLSIEIFENCGIVSPLERFGSNFEINCELLINLANRTASELHEKWRAEFALNNGKETPRWKKIKDIEFIENLDENNIPPNIRKNNGVWEIDIAHTPFEKLSSDWQYENLEAGKIVAGLVLRNQFEKLNRDQVGTIIHNEWLKRNEWAKEDAVLSLPFEELPKLEQKKDLIQFAICLEEFKAMQLEKEQGKER